VCSSDLYDPKDKRLRALGNDAGNARRFIVEGEATLTMMAYLVAAMTHKDALDPAMLPALEMQLRALGKMGIEQLKEMIKDQSGGFVEMDESILASIKAMDDIPLVILLPLLESYMRGASPVLAAYKHGGWDEVGKLYTQPPESTEQVLHPDTKLYPARDLPRTLTLPQAPAGYQLLNTDTIGELEWRVYFLLWDKASSDDAAAGWDGDRYAVFRDKQGHLITYLATTWDSEADAEELEAAYRRSLVKRFGGDGSKRPEGTPIALARRGAEVFVVDGPGADKLLPALVKGTKLSPP
jgi:hypothetical protein